MKTRIMLNIASIIIGIFVLYVDIDLVYDLAKVNFFKEGAPIWVMLIIIALCVAGLGNIIIGIRGLINNEK
jgi:hypothetical protein